MSLPSSRAPWWMYVVAASFLGTFGLQIYTSSSFYPGPGPIGFFIDLNRSDVAVERVIPGGLGERAGLRPGDRIVAVNDVPITRRVEWDFATTTFEVGKPMPLEIERESKRLVFTITLERRTGSLIAGEFWILAAGNLVTLALGVVIAFRRPHDWSARIGGWFLATAAISIFPPVPGIAAALKSLPLPLGLLLFSTMASEAVIGAIQITFFAAFPRPLFRRRWIWGLIWIPALIVAIPRFVRSLDFIYGWKWTSPMQEFRATTQFTVGVLYLLVSLSVLVLNYRRLTDTNERRRMRVLVAGSIVGWISIAAFLTIIVIGGGPFVAALWRTPLPTLLLVLYLLFPLSFAYAILRHRVFDLGLIVRQGLQYALARGVLLTAVPALGVLLLADLLLHGQQPLLAIVRARGWVYVLLGALAAVAYTKRGSWLEGLDRRFFRERYDAQRLLREVVEEVREARSFERVAPRVAARVEAALHPEFVALMVHEPREPNYRSLAAAPAGQTIPPVPAESKLVSLVRLLGKPLEMPQTGSSWLGQQLPHEETDFLRRARIELLVPVASSAEHTEALLVLGVKKSEEPYSREDQDLLIAIASSLALLLERPSDARTPRSDVFEECPQCGTCYDSGSTQCAQEGARLVPVILPRLLETRYRLERRLGRGGMGTVYAASDTELERRVAVKVIREDLVGSAEAAERFRREARAAASFSHPNVVTVHDFGVAAGTRAFLVMELLQGCTLREGMNREKRFSAQRTLEILRGVCAALEAAHRRPLVHRDLKPENIFLASGNHGETTKVLDFGIAKFLSTTSQQLTADTAPGALLGTPRYMSPEQWRGEAASQTWDLWALGVVAYEMLAGAHPFDGKSPAEWLSTGAAAKLIPIGLHVPEFRGSLQEFFEGALAYDAARRPVSAEGFFSELQAALA